MEECKGILRTRLYYVEHLNPQSSQDLKDIKNFYIQDENGQGLDDYIKYYACGDEENREMRTYLVRTISGDECVGYFSLKAGLVSVNESEEYDEDTGEAIQTFDTLPGVELADFAVNSAFIEKYPSLKGVGLLIFSEFIIPLVNMAAQYVGVKMIYIFALPFDRLIRRYEKYGFRRLSGEAEYDLHKRLKPRYDQECRFMYQLL